METVELTLGEICELKTNTEQIGKSWDSINQMYGCPRASGDSLRKNWKTLSEEWSNKKANIEATKPKPPKTAEELIAEERERQKAKLEIIPNLVDLGLTAEQIASTLGLSLEQVKKCIP